MHIRALETAKAEMLYMDQHNIANEQIDPSHLTTLLRGCPCLKTVQISFRETPDREESHKEPWSSFRREARVPPDRNPNFNYQVRGMEAFARSVRQVGAHLRKLVSPVSDSKTSLSIQNATLADGEYMFRGLRDLRVSLELESEHGM